MRSEEAQFLYISNGMVKNQFTRTRTFHEVLLCFTAVLRVVPIQWAALGLRVCFVEILTLFPVCTKVLYFKGTHVFLLLTISDLVWKAVAKQSCNKILVFKDPA